MFMKRTKKYRKILNEYKENNLNIADIYIRHQ